MSRYERIVIAVALGIFALCFLLIVEEGLYENSQFEARAVHAKATITELRKNVRRGRYGSTTFTYRLRCRFWDMEQIDTWMTILPETYNSLKVGEEVPVKYLAEDPMAARLDTDADRQLHSRLQRDLLVLGAYAVVGVALLWIRVRRD